jgi:glycosyltransferase involved in cell wall biosynthesis
MPRRLALLVPGGLHSTTGGNVYDGAVVAELERRGWFVDLVEPGTAALGQDVCIVDSLALRFGPPAADGVVVALLHQLPSEAEERPDWRTPEAGTLAAADLVVTVSDGLARRVRSLATTPVVTVPPGWDRSVGAANAPRDTVLCVANAQRGKGVADAVIALARSGVRQDLVLVGDTHRDAGEAERLRSALGQTRRRVSLTGVVSADELARFYGRARVFVTATRYEGWPIAVAEAMANGVPVVGYLAPGVSELVRTGVDGVLVPPGDVDALAAALARVVEDPPLADRLGRAARDRARAWPTWRETARRFADLIEQVAEEGHAGRLPRAQATGPR